LFVAILQQSYAGGGEFFGREEQAGAAGKA